MPYLRLLALLLVLLAPLAACSKQDMPIAVSEDDAEMVAAIAKARASLPGFWQAFESRSRGERDFSLKVKITDNHGVEHFWLIDIEKSDGKVFGTIDNDPVIVRNVRLGDRIEIPDADISDWLYMRGGKMVGNETMRPLLKTMPKDEADQLRSLMADP